MRGLKRKTQKGYSYVEFSDARGLRQTIWQSSSVGERPEPGHSFVWIGHMLLDRERAQMIVDRLTEWIETGDFADGG